MGSLLSCLWEEEEVGGGLDKHALARLAKLKEGARFGKKKAIFLSDTVFLRLNEAEDALNWKETDKAAGSSGSMPLSDIAQFAPVGERAILVKGASSKLMEIELLDAPAGSGERDSWVTALTEVLHRYQTSPAMVEREEAIRKAAFSEGKKSYWGERKAQLKANEADAKSRKEKYAGVGLNYTAKAMAARG